MQLQPSPGTGEIIIFFFSRKKKDTAKTKWYRGAHFNTLLETEAERNLDKQEYVLSLEYAHTHKKQSIKYMSFKAVCKHPKNITPSIILPVLVATVVKIHQFWDLKTLKPFSQWLAECCCYFNVLIYSTVQQKLHSHKRNKQQSVAERFKGVIPILRFYFQDTS